MRVIVLLIFCMSEHWTLDVGYVQDNTQLVPISRLMTDCDVASSPPKYPYPNMGGIQ